MDRLPDVNRIKEYFAHMKYTDSLKAEESLTYLVVKELYNICKEIDEECAHLSTKFLSVNESMRSTFHTREEVKGARNRLEVLRTRREVIQIMYERHKEKLSDLQTQIKVENVKKRLDGR